MTRFERIRDAYRTAAELDHKWVTREHGHARPESVPWIPFPVYDFTALVAEAIPEATGNRFLEIGCGIGTRLLVAEQVFGLDARGFDLVDAYVAQARRLGATAETADALEYGGYGAADIIWFNRPLRGAALELQLEETVWRQARPGAVVICANLESRPPGEWWLVLDDMGVRRGIWQKPDPLIGLPPR